MTHHHESRETLDRPPTRRARAVEVVRSIGRAIAGGHDHSHAHAHGEHHEEAAVAVGVDLNPCSGGPGLDAAVRAHNELVVIRQAEAAAKADVPLPN